VAVDLALVPEPHRDTVRAALHGAFPAGDVDALEPGPSGASGALTYRVRRTGDDHLLRIEGSRIPERNPHQYRNMEAAAAAGIAPPVRLVDDEAGVMVVRWLDVQPLATYPTGKDGLAGDVGALLARLHQLEPFPSRDQDWAEMVSRLLGYVQVTGVVRRGLLEDVAVGFERIRAAWDRDPSELVAAHNDPNASNIVYDGHRLWLVDWETSSPNDPLIDLGVAANQLAPTPELRDAMLTAWRGSPPDDLLRARLTLAQLAAQVFAGAAIALITGQLGSPPLTDLDAVTPAEFERRVMSGELAMGAPETMATFAKVVLAQARTVVGSADFETALAIAAAG
jgi:aminoglycoside phosphotransferase (APT) family kinase protein